MFRYVVLIFLMPAIVQAKVVETIVAIVNNEIITESDLDSYKAKLKTGGLIDDAVLKIKTPKEILKSRQSLIDHMIDEKLIDSEVKQKNLSVTIEKVEAEIRGITSRNNITRAQLKSALQEKGIKFSDYQNFVKTSLERQALIEKEVSSKIKISDEDVKDYYIKQSGASDSQVFEYTLAHIIFLNKNGGPEETLKKAKLIEDKINRGESFEELSSKYSEDPNFSQGGLLGTFRAGELQPEVEKAVGNLAENKVSPPVKTRLGYQIFKVVKKNLIADPKLDLEKGRIQNMLFAQAFKDQFKGWLETKRQEASVRIN